MPHIILPHIILPQAMTIAIAWNRLIAVNQLSVRTTSSPAANHIAVGSGTVVVERIGDNIVVFREHGQWNLTAGRCLSFTNAYRWTRVDNLDVLRLEHLRRGPGEPVFLCDLRQTETGKFAAIEPHRCGQDVYSAMLGVQADGLHLDWTIAGPTKSDRIETLYE